MTLIVLHVTAYAAMGTLVCDAAAQYEDSTGIRHWEPLGSAQTGLDGHEPGRSDFARVLARVVRQLGDDPEAP